MKTKTLVIAIVAFFSITAVQASDAKKEVISKVKKEMKYPSYAITEDLEGDVWVAFRVNDNGNFQVFQANSVNQELKKLVVEQLEKITPPEAGAAANEIYYMKFSFKLRK